MIYFCKIVIILNIIVNIGKNNKYEQFLLNRLIVKKIQKHNS